jgi:hypothetical protein
MPVILATQEAEIRRNMVRSQPGEKFKTSYLRKTQHKNRAGRVAHVCGLTSVSSNSSVTKKQKKMQSLRPV